MSLRVEDSQSILELLTLPSNSKALSNYQPKLHIVSSHAVDASSASRNQSPHRKAARLEGDSDHSTSTSRAKGKGKQRAVEEGVNSGLDGVKTYRLMHRPECKTDEAYLDALPRAVANAIHQVLAKPQFSSFVGSYMHDRTFFYEDIYRATRSAVLVARMGQRLHDSLLFELREVTKDVRVGLTAEARGTDALEWMCRLVNVTQWYGKCIGVLEGLLAYLDRIYIPQNKKLLHVRQLAIQTYRDVVFENVNVQRQTQGGLLQWLRWERTERQPHPQRGLIINLISLLSEYSLFNDLYFKTYITETTRFYEEESEREAASAGDISVFMEGVWRRLTEEENRWQEITPTYTFDWPEVLRTLEMALLKKRLPWMSVGVERGVNERNLAGLQRMYNLFGRVDGRGLLCEKFKAHVYKLVGSVVCDKERDDELVDRLLEFKAFVDTAITEAFESNRSFANAANDAFSKGFKLRKIKPAEMIAKYLDREMRRGQKAATDEQFSDKLDAVLGLYRFTEDKDVFRTFYHRALSKRLLLNRSASDDFEKRVLKTLKTKFDPEFDMGENMFRDLTLSNDLMKEFHEKEDINDSTASGAKKGKLHASVLEAAYWPFSSNRQEFIVLLPEMQIELNKFERFYLNKHQGRKLNFDHSLGTAQVTASFDAGKKELHVSLYQAIVLLLFNDRDEIPFMDIKEQTRMEDKELRRILQSLACGKKKVLKKRPAGREVDDTDVFIYNAGFTDERAHVHISQIQVKETAEEKEKIESGIQMERKSVLDAAIVRIMKAKKKLSHAMLTNEVIDTMTKHFKPEVAMIKQRIEQLIEQEYMRRDEEERNVYVYVA